MEWINEASTAIESVVAGSGTWLPVTVAIASPFLLTWTYTSLRYLAWSMKTNPTEPLTPPYMIPFVGHTIPFAFDTENYLQRLRKRFGQSPIRLLVGGDVFTFVPHGQTLLTLFKSKDVNGKEMTVRSLRDSFGTPDHAMEFFYNDASGLFATPLPGHEDMDPNKRIFHNLYRDLHALLQGQVLTSMLEEFIDRFTARVEKNTAIKFDEWTVCDDLYGMLKRDLFYASMEALCGDHLFEAAPDFCEDFWEFDKALPTIFKKTPKWLAPKAWASRDKICDDIKKWLDYADAHFDWNNEELVNCNWEPYYGSKLMRARQIFYRNMGLRKEAYPAMELGLIWATNSNAIPTTFWTVFGILQNDNLKSRALVEIDACFPAGSKGIDVTKLTQGPLSLSMYHESLRYAVSVVNVRSPNHNGFPLLNFRFPNSTIFVTSSWAGGRDRSFWNTGRVGPNGSEEHPLDTWWAERFLEYRDDPLSGPIRKPDPELYRNAKPAPVRTPEDDKHASVITAGTGGHSFPYGGGIKICPGRFFAKNEMIGAAAILLRLYDIELLEPAAASKVKLDKAYFPFGALPPDRKIPVRIRRRRV